MIPESKYVGSQKTDTLIRCDQKRRCRGFQEKNHETSNGEKAEALGEIEGGLKGISKTTTKMRKKKEEIQKGFQKKKNTGGIRRAIQSGLKRGKTKREVQSLYYELISGATLLSAKKVGGAQQKRLTGKIVVVTGEKKPVVKEGGKPGGGKP